MLQLIYELRPNGPKNDKNKNKNKNNNNNCQIAYSRSDPWSGSDKNVQALENKRHNEIYLKFFASFIHRFSHP